ncbi:iron-containing alcohol dehydrogenase [Clostridium felsineum]|uniref:iron-containing alcohol dehydrogenase n=1 Tax=Clostridium felsineum TaxID=36839 RepID=UPI00098C0951|nr:iron-containing alcohol dehydrogenase [Clostridium felsineum]URZ16646.1 Long-chain-alcohol dehydrogenase 2 [Clostridium felsineum DSM 794]
MNEFTFSYPVRVYFGEGAAKKALRAELGKVGETVMLAYGGGSVKTNGVYDELVQLLTEAGKEVVDFAGIMPNPTYSKVQEGARLVREKGVDFILAVGGGSVIDCCKVVSAQATLGEDIWDMEYKSNKFPTAGITMGAVVTASGTGAEMNPGAVITYEDKMWKGPIVGTYASFAVLDPAYTLSLPMKQVISGAFDTLSHCMETYLGTPRDFNTSDEINEAVMRSTIRNIRKLLVDGKDMDARSELMWTSAMAENGILKIGKVTDFQAHQIEHQLGAYTDCNHGQGLAAIHPALYRHMAPSGTKQFARLAREVWNVDEAGKSEEEIALAGVDALAAFIKEIGLPTTLSKMSITDEGILRSVANTCNLTAGCCKKFERDEIFEILKESM